MPCTLLTARRVLWLCSGGVQVESRSDYLQIGVFRIGLMGDSASAHPQGDRLSIGTGGVHAANGKVAMTVGNFREFLRALRLNPSKQDSLHLKTVMQAWFGATVVQVVGLVWIVVSHLFPRSASEDD